MKRCSKCGIEKSLDCFNKDKRKKDGVRYCCKDCRKALNKKRYDANPELAKAKSKAWYDANPDLAKQISKKYRQYNTEKVKAAAKKVNEDLHDWILKQHLKSQGFPPEAITQELIEVKRIIIKTKRLCKTLQI